MFVKEARDVNSIMVVVVVDSGQWAVCGSPTHSLHDHSYSLPRLGCCSTGHPYHSNTDTNPVTCAVASLVEPTYLYPVMMWKAWGSSRES